MSRSAKIALAFGLSAVLGIGIAVTVSSGFHGLVIYTFFAFFALATAFLGGFGGGRIQEWSSNRFKDPQGR